MSVSFSKRKTVDSPLSLVIKVGLVVLAAEFVIMVAIEGLLRPIVDVPLFWQVMDPVLLAAIVGPVLYLWVLRPMQEQEKDLRIAAVAFESQNAMMITDEQGLILRVNPAFRRVTGYTAQDVIGRSCRWIKSGSIGPCCSISREPATRPSREASSAWARGWVWR